ncbi:MAG: nucleoside hydrolase [Gammaproteobacteria bacterium]|nr:nucleoside hydrolase [Gammaproteobacteria bacterium]
MRKLLFLLFSFWIGTAFALATAPQYIIDTDMGFDDWLAVLYLLKQPVTIDAITVDCQGESRCPIGAVNAEKLSHLAKRDVPIAYGNSRPLSIYDFPKAIRDYASNMAVPGFLHIKTDSTCVKISAAQIIFNDVINAAKENKKVVIISIGTASNIDNAWKLAEKKNKEKVFRHGLEMIVKGGGAFGTVEKGHLTDHSMRGNIAIPGISQSQNKIAEWNIYANAPAMRDLIDANLPITFVPNNATDEVPMTKKIADELYRTSSTNEIRRFNANALFSLFKLQGTTKDLDFWDTAVTICALHPSIVTEKFKYIPLKITVKSGDDYGATWVTTKSTHDVTVYYHLNKSLFYKKLFDDI